MEGLYLVKCIHLQKEGDLVPELSLPQQPSLPEGFREFLEFVLVAGRDLS